MKKSTTLYIVGFAIIAILVIGTLAYGNSEGKEFGGSDDAGGDVIADHDGEEGDHEPWTNGIWGDYELPGETESFLFALQAAIGAVIIGFFIGWNYANRKNKNALEDQAEELKSEESEAKE